MKGLFFLVISISTAIANPITAALSDLHTSNLDSDFSPEVNPVASIPDDNGSEIPPQPDWNNLIDHKEKNEMSKRGSMCSVHRPKAVSQTILELKNYVSHYKVTRKPPASLSEALQRAVWKVDRSFDPVPEDPDPGCADDPQLKIHLTCEGPEIAAPTMIDNSIALFVINCVRHGADQIPARFWYSTADTVAQYCCGFWRNAVSLRPRKKGQPPVAEICI